MTTNPTDWKDSYNGKLWSTAVQKCFEAPFAEVAIQHLLQRIDEQHQKELSLSKETGMREGREEIVANFPENPYQEIVDIERHDIAEWALIEHGKRLGFERAKADLITKIQANQ